MKYLVIDYDFKLPLLLTKKDVELEIGGIGVENAEIVRTLMKYGGGEVAILTWKGAKKYITKEEIGVEVLEVLDRKKRINIFSLMRCLIAFSSFRPNIVIFKGFGYLIFIYGIMSYLYECTYVFRLSTDIQIEDKYRSRANVSGVILFILTFIRNLGYRFVDIFLCQNQKQHEHFVKRFGIGKVCIWVDSIEAPSERVFLKAERKYVAWLGRFCDEKNMAPIVDVATANPNIKFKIAGGYSGGVTNYTINAVKMLGQLKNVEFVGILDRSQVPLFLREALCLLNTSFYEGFPRTYLEALSVGTPLFIVRHIDPDDMVRKFNLGFAADTYEDLPLMLDNLIKRADYASLCHRCKQYAIDYHAHEVNKRIISTWITK